MMENEFSNFIFNLFFTRMSLVDSPPVLSLFVCGRYIFQHFDEIKKIVFDSDRPDSMLFFYFIIFFISVIKNYYVFLVDAFHDNILNMYKVINMASMSFISEVQCDINPSLFFFLLFLSLNTYAFFDFSSNLQNFL